MRLSLLPLATALSLLAMSAGCAEGGEIRGSGTFGDSFGTTTTTATGDGDGDMTTTTTTGDGDGDMTTTTTGDGDGDGDMTTTTTSGDGDGDPGPMCGNGVVEGDEECDDGNPVDTDDCLSTCVAATCGDGFVHEGVEGCDEGENNSDMGECSLDCQLATCGDGVIQPGEECDGDMFDNGSCSRCLITCVEGFDNCNGELVDGCEVELCGGTCDNPGASSGMETFDYSGQVEEFVVPGCVGTLTIEAWGAQGGDNPNLNGEGGQGARMSGDFEVSEGQVLQIVVGQMGSEPAQGNQANGAGGGGGGSFVWTEGENDPMLVAGGGGASCLQNNGLPHYQGKDGVTTEAGSGSRSDDQFNDSPGGTNGGDGKSVSGSGGNGWNTVKNNPAGVSACQGYGGNGGYGGGGGGGCSPNPCNDLHIGGGGGGYSGGGAGGSCYYHGGGGGGSYNAGANQDNEAGAKTGNGQVVLSW